MKTLSIKQPWATLIMEEVKKYEFRDWKTNYRGELIIHASKTVDKEAIKRLKKYLPDELPTGKILGTVMITDCIPVTEEFSKWLLEENSDIYANSPNSKYAFKIDNVKIFKNPIDAKGKLGLWDYDLK